jgi:hypothetical protein
MENNPKSQVIDRVKEAQNVLISVSANPSIDQLSAALGFTLMLNALGKHATAVFSGEVPSVIEFLKPEDTLEKNTDSLRDFIISLDKAKADKLKYKVEEEVVKIFITPYKTSLSDADLEFSQGDFNVDVVVALGVDQRDHLDQAITAHGRILHDATVISLMSGNMVSDLGSINWQDPNASSLCEMVAGLSESFQGNLIDSQMATAFLTGIVAETERFSNEKTSPKVMTMSAQLMAAGANQQLIATQLETVIPEEPVPQELPKPEIIEEPEATEGEISLHDMPDIPEEAPKPIESDIPEEIINIDDQGTLKTARELAEAVNTVKSNSETAKAEQPKFSKYMKEKPFNYKEFTGALMDGESEPSVDPLSENPYSGPLGSELEPLIQSESPTQAENTLGPEVKTDNTIEEIEQTVSEYNATDADSARKAVDDAIGSGDGFDPNRPKPIQSLGAQEFVADENPPVVPPPLIPPFPIPEEQTQQQNN